MHFELPSHEGVWRAGGGGGLQGRQGTSTPRAARARAPRGATRVPPARALGRAHPSLATRWCQRAATTLAAPVRQQAAPAARAAGRRPCRATAAAAPPPPPAGCGCVQARVRTATRAVTPILRTLPGRSGHQRGGSAPRARRKAGRGASAHALPTAAKRASSGDGCSTRRRRQRLHARRQPRHLARPARRLPWLPRPIAHLNPL